jgi:hypothetical protein
MAPRSPPRKIHWRVPTVIILAFVAGLAFALGHHAFYSSLNGQPVDDYIFGQQINLAVGQAFAFLVRASLVISIGASYWQVFWGTVLHATLALSQVDVLAGMLGSVLDLLDLGASRTRPILVALALLSWMVPLASLLPPATLSVHSTTTPAYEKLRVPMPRFDLLSMARKTSRPGTMADANLTYDWHYSRPTRQIARLVTAAAYRGAILDHHTVFPNSTYTLDFPGPAMRCQDVPEDLLHDFNEAMNCSFIPNRADDEPKAECGNVVTYLSWVPGIKEGNFTAAEPSVESVPLKPNSMTDGTLPLESRIFDFSPYIGGFTGGDTSVFLATRSQRLPYDIDNWDLLNCSMYNASYSVNVTSDSDSRGTFSKPELRTLNSVPFNISVSTHTVSAPFSEKDSATFGYLAIMDILNRLIVGTIFGDETVVLGSGYYDVDLLEVQNQGFKQTLLPFTAELLPFQSHFDEPDEVPLDTRLWTEVDTIEVPEAFNKANVSRVGTVSYPKAAFLSPTFNRSLASVVEELFHNMTLSLFSTEAYLQNSTEDIHIKYNITQNTYAYDSRNLLISYGLAVSFALLAGIAGCISILSNGASYSNRFSTILRTTRGQELEELIAHNDRTGVDPLPKHLEKSRIDLRRGQVESQHDVDAWRPENVSEQTSMISILRSDGQVGGSS